MDWDDDEREHVEAVSPGRTQTLAQRLGVLLQNLRADRNLTQQDVAVRVGRTQSAVSRFERGAMSASVAFVEQVFAAFDLQVRVDTEPLGTDLDAEVDRYSNLSDAERADEVNAFAYQFKKLGDLPYVLSGRLAALIQGAPVSAAWLDLAVQEEDLERYAELFHEQVAHRWNERFHMFDWGRSDPRAAGPMRWWFAGQELRLEVHAEPPRTVTVVVGGQPWAVRALPDIEDAYPDVRRVMDRWRARRTGRGSP